MKIFRLICAFILSPLIVGLIIAGGIEIFIKHQGMLHLANMFFTIGAYPLMLFIGLPIYLCLERKKLENFEAYILSGAVGGAIPALLLSIKQIEQSNSGIGILIMIGLIYGSLLGLSFWLIAKKKYRKVD